MLTVLHVRNTHTCAREHKGTSSSEIQTLTVYIITSFWWLEASRWDKMMLLTKVWQYYRPHTTPFAIWNWICQQLNSYSYSSWHSNKKFMTAQSTLTLPMGSYFMYNSLPILCQFHVSFLLFFYLKKKKKWYHTQTESFCLLHYIQCNLNLWDCTVLLLTSYTVLHYTVLCSNYLAEKIFIVLLEARLRTKRAATATKC